MANVKFFDIKLEHGLLRLILLSKVMTSGQLTSKFNKHCIKYLALRLKVIKFSLWSTGNVEY